MWIDSNDCSQRWHEFKRDANDRVKAFHADGDACEKVEFYIPESTDLEGEN